MKNILLTVLATASLTSLFSLPMAPASACTPHPDHPDACDDWPIRRIDPARVEIKKPFPFPVCLSCPTAVLKTPTDLVLPADRVQDLNIKDSTIPTLQNRNLAPSIVQN